MAWFGRVCNNLEDHIEEACQFVEEKMVVLGQNLRVMCLDGVDDITPGFFKFDETNIRMTEEEGMVMCDVINTSPYALPYDDVESIKKDSEIDIEGHEDSDAGVNADIPVIITKSADNNTESPNGEESSVTGSSHFDSLTSSSLFDTITSSSDAESVTGSSHFDLGMGTDDVSDGWLKFDDPVDRYRSATASNDYFDNIMMQEATSQLKVVSEKTENMLDAKLSTPNDEWEIVNY